MTATLAKTAALEPGLPVGSPKPESGASLSLIALLAFLGVPLVALFVYSISRGWGASLVPTEYTLDYWRSALTSSSVLAAAGRSLALTVIVVVINWLLVLPAAYVAVVVNPKIRPIIHALAIVPFALPWIVIAAGIQLTVGEFAPQLFATVGLLIFTLCGVTFPYLYWSFSV